MKYSLGFFFSILLFVTGVHAQRIAPDVLPVNKDILTIQPIVHASLVLSTKKLTIYVDPSGGAANYTGLSSPDLILITDIHGDHFDPATIAAVATSNTVLIVPKAVADKMPDSVKVKMEILNNGDTKAFS